MKISLLALALVGWACPALAQPEGAPKPPEASPAKTGPVVIPDTTAGKHLKWCLDVFGGGEPGDLHARFSASFLKQVPEAQLKLTLKQLADQIFEGEAPELVQTSPDGTDVRLVAELKPKGNDTRWWVFINVDKDGKMEGLLIRPKQTTPPVEFKSFEELDGALKTLSMSVAYGAYRVQEKDGVFELEPLHEFQADRRLAMGSAFKLWVLGALAERVEKGERKWTDEVEIKESMKSLPSGVTQNEPEGAKLAISTLADRMISISDNTATDILLDVAGRANVEAYMARLHGKPELNTPFLKTMEMFKIKLSADKTAIDRYAKADVAGRRAMLETEIPGLVVQLDDAATWKTPRRVDAVEWFASPKECARVLADLHRLERKPGLEAVGHSLRINPGIPDAKKLYKSIAYKGGSEPGVLNLSWLVERNDGAWVAVSIAFNNETVGLNEEALIGIAGAARDVAGR